eukprot:1400981-Alexandrium_andersonii.AAC.1
MVASFRPPRRCELLPARKQAVFGGALCSLLAPGGRHGVGVVPACRQARMGARGFFVLTATHNM